MADKELIERIQSLHEKGKKEAVAKDERNVKFLVFGIKDKRYALYAEEVREIVLDVPLFYVPFVPPYVRGFINRHGEPYTAIDPNVLFEKEKIDSSTFLILNIKDDRLACMISDIHEIAKVPEKNIHLIASGEEAEGFFAGSIALEGKEIFILNLQNIRKKLENDFDAT